ncbi:MAG: DMT family transporter [Bacteroidales bacterium]|nr:DMT family transporter [Bacteroidales bacterium]
MFSILSLIGVALVVFNGQFILKLNPIGDALTFGAVILWALYSVIIVWLKKYPTAMITRKIFFYGLVTMLPYFIFFPPTLTKEMFLATGSISSLIFLSVIASFGCYYAWNLVIEKIGPVTSTNYLYLNPIAAMLISVPVLGERITALSILGSVLIIGGMYLAQKTR